VPEGKESTARVTMRQGYEILHSYSLECSVCGPTEGKLAKQHFTIPALKEMGEDFCLALFDFTSNQTKVE
jgi:hypothetical protein